MKAAIFTIAFAIALIKTNAGVTADTPWIGLRLAGPFTLSAKQPKKFDQYTIHPYQSRITSRA